jgi:hypothetical protein
MSKYNRIVPLSFVAAVAALFLSVLSVNAQDSTQVNRSSEKVTSTQIVIDRDSNTKAVTQLSLKIKENENKEVADINEKIKTQQAAQAKSQKMTAAVTKAELALSVRISAVERAERRLQQMSTCSKASRFSIVRRRRNDVSRRIGEMTSASRRNRSRRRTAEI